MDILKHLQSRGFDPHRYGNVPMTDEVAVFYLWNLSGQLVGYQNYRPLGNKKNNNDPKDGKYYTYAKDNIAVWGLETYFYRNDILFLTEGVFDAVKLHALNLPAVAVLANDPKKIRSWLYALPRYIVAVCDDDQAGKKLGKLGNMSIVVSGGKDLGDLSVGQAKSLILNANMNWLTID